MCYSNENRVYTNIDIYDCEKYEVGQALSDSYYEGGGTNLALTWTSYLTDNLSMKLMHGRTERTSVSGSPNDVDCNYVSAGGGVVDAGVPLGCTNNLSVYDRTDEREQTRADFERLLGDHMLRFGYDAEINTYDLSQGYSGPGGVTSSVSTTTPGAQIPAPGPRPAGYNAHDRTSAVEGKREA